MSFHIFKSESISIKEWTSKFKELYINTDAPRKPEEYWNAVMAHLSCVGEAIRRIHYPELLLSSASAFCWMCSYVSKCNSGDDKLFQFNHNLSEIVALKFPRKCGHCIKPECECDPVKMDEEKDKSGRYEKLLEEWNYEKGLKDCSITEWLKIFFKIYKGRLHLQTMESLGFHLLEEAGEEAMAVRNLVQFRGILDEQFAGIDEGFLKEISSIPGLVQEYTKSLKDLTVKYGVKTEKEAKKKINYTDDDPIVIKARLVIAKMDFVIELADTFSWFCAVLLKLSETIKSFEHNEDSFISTGITKEQLENMHIEQALIERYKFISEDTPLTCYACGQTTCACLFYPKTNLL